MPARQGKPSPACAGKCTRLGLRASRIRPKNGNRTTTTTGNLLAIPSDRDFALYAAGPRIPARANSRQDERTCDAAYSLEPKPPARHLDLRGAFAFECADN